MISRGIGVALAALLALGCAEKPNQALLRRQAGDEAYRQGDYAAAVLEYGQSLAADPRQVGVWEKVAACRLHLGDRDGAASAMLRTVELRPAPAQKAEVYRTVAGFYLQSPERAKGERYLLEVLKLAPDDDGTLSWLGELEAERGGARSGDAPAVPEHLEGALRYYDRLIALRPEAPVYYAHKRAVLAKYLQHLGERCRAAERALRTTPRDRAAEARVRIAEMRARADELQRDLDGVVRRLGELRRHRPVG